MVSERHKLAHYMAMARGVLRSVPGTALMAQLVQLFPGKLPLPAWSQHSAGRKACFASLHCWTYELDSIFRDGLQPPALKWHRVEYAD